MYIMTTNSSPNPSNHLYEKVLLDYLNSLRPNPPVYPRNPLSRKLAIMIEPRYDDITIAVLYNFMHFMAESNAAQDEVSSGWNFMLISYAEHEESVKTRFPNLDFVPLEDKYIEMRDGKPNISMKSYNEILLSISFWRSTIPAQYENICIFQRDCIMFRPIPSMFEKYSFAGATYHDIVEDNVYLKTTPFFYPGINGGFSLRKRRDMMLCIYSVTIENTINYRRQQLEFLKDFYEINYKLSNKKFVDFGFNIYNEDVFFSNTCEMLHLHVPDQYNATRLAIEMDANLSYKPSVYHGWDKSYHGYPFAMKYLSDSPLFAPFVHTQQQQQLVDTKVNPVYVLPENLCD